MYIEWRLDWVHFLSRDARKCNRRWLVICRQAPIFRRWEECCPVSLLKINTLLASFHAASRAPCSCHSVSSWNRSSNFGATLMRFTWGKSIRAKDFGRECMRVVHQLLWILHFGPVSVCLSSSVKSMKTSATPWNPQPNKRVIDELHTTGPWRSWLVSRQTTVFLVPSYDSCFFKIPFFVDFCWAVHQPG